MERQSSLRWIRYATQLVGSFSFAFTRFCRQDPLGFQGRLVKDSAPGPGEAAGNASRYQIYGKKSADGSVNALLLNRGDVTLDITLVFADVWVESGAELVLRDLWAEKDIGKFSGSYTAKAVPSHGNVALSMRNANDTSAASAST